MEDPNPLLLPPGFRFQPTDEDLVDHYLRSRHLPPLSRPSSPLLQDAIKDLDIYCNDPKNLSGSACLLSADDEKRWYFFTPRAKGKLAGAAKRKAKGGYWRRKGVDQPVVSRKRGVVLGVKKKFVFYRGASSSLPRTRWVMHEYELADSEFSPSKECFALCCVFKEVKQIPVPQDEYLSNAVNNDDVNIAFKKDDKQDMLGSFLMAFPDEHNGLLTEERIDNDFLPMMQEKLSSVSAIEDRNYTTNKLSETAVLEGDFIELNDLYSPQLEARNSACFPERRKLQILVSQVTEWRSLNMMKYQVLISQMFQLPNMLISQSKRSKCCFLKMPTPMCWFQSK